MITTRSEVLKLMTKARNDGRPIDKNGLQRIADSRQYSMSEIYKVMREIVKDELALLMLRARKRKRDVSAFSLTELTHNGWYSMEHIYYMMWEVADAFTTSEQKHQAA